MNRQPNEKINYLYGRLSHEDELQGDSNSIINQRKILTKYAEDNGFTPYEFIYDDGFSGADFERPAFSRMMEDVEAGKVATVIVKDMSRFGRDYLKVGFYTEIVFAEKDVRLIAVNDNVDTERGENDFAPMMNLFNEWYVKNTRKSGPCGRPRAKAANASPLSRLTATAKTRKTPNSLSSTRKAPPWCAEFSGFPWKGTAPRRLPGRSTANTF